MKAVFFLSAAIATALSVAWGPLSAQGGVVHADGPPVWGTGVRLVPAVTIGVLDGPPEYAFGSVAFVVGEKGGEFTVFDSKYGQLRRYSASGKLIANIGGPGAGPGEYRDLLGLALLGDSSLVSWDPRNARVTFFGLDGKVRGSFTAILGGTTYSPDAFAIDNNGIVYLLNGRTRRYVRFRSNGAVLDTLTSVDGDTRGFVLSTTDGTRPSFVVRRLAKPSPLGGLISASTDTLGFTATVGGRRLTVQRTYAPVRLGAEERREWEAYAEWFYAQAKAEPPRPGIPRLEPTLAKIPSTKPAIRDFRVDRDGRIWLDVYTTAEKRVIPPRPKGDSRPRLTWRERSTYDVFMVSGQYLGRIVLPAEHELLDARGDRVWTLTSGPDGEDRIVVFQLVPK